jgi:hypothetical protein
MSNIAIRVSLLAALAASMCFVACSNGNDPGTSTDSPVKRYFFPTTNGAIYTYSRTVTRDGHIVTDTLRCQLDVAQNLATKNDLRDIATNKILYYFDLSHDALNNYAATLSSGDTTLYALDGTLQDGATWIADPTHHIRATVTQHIDDYYAPLPANVHFPDVISVKYQTDSLPGSIYTLRIFASGHGLIREAEVVPGGATGSSEISSLQVLSIQ